MLFDLKGKRRRAVQGTYLTLAVLMGAGLVLFGIGSSVNGGLSDLFSGNSGSNKGNQLVEKRIKTAEKQLETNPRDEAALGEVIRGHYQLASANIDRAGKPHKGATDDLQAAADTWERYVALKPQKPNLGLARVMVQAYSGLAQGVKEQADAQPYWAGASSAIELIAGRQPNSDNYVGLVQYATLAGQASKAELAGKKAIELAPKGQRKQIEQQVASAKSAGQQTPGAGAAAAPGTAP
jgi:hypothetical protein